MTLPEGFLFNQSNLQDYVDCQRRFQLRYILHLSWPAVEAEPISEFERMMEHGSHFHKLVHQFLIGVPESQIEHSLGRDDVLAAWWNSFQRSLKDGTLGMIFQEGNKLFEEITLSIPMDEFRLIAKYDLLILQSDGKWIILDWKTSQNHPKRRWLADRLQTHVYPFVLAKSGTGIIRHIQADPDRMEMIYWFANQPEQPERFDYNQSAIQADENYLNNLISTITQKTEKVFPLTPDVKRCLFCTYRSLCNRGVKPGELVHLEEWQESELSSEQVTIDYDQIGEIPF